MKQVRKLAFSQGTDFKEIRTGMRRDPAPSTHCTCHALLAHLAVAGHQSDQALDGDRLRQLKIMQTIYL